MVYFICGWQELHCVSQSHDVWASKSIVWCSTGVSLWPSIFGIKQHLNKLRSLAKRNLHNLILLEDWFLVQHSPKSINQLLLHNILQYKRSQGDVETIIHVFVSSRLDCVDTVFTWRSYMKRELCLHLCVRVRCGLWHLDKLPVDELDSSSVIISWKQRELLHHYSDLAPALPPPEHMHMQNADHVQRIQLDFFIGGNCFNY